jgi:IMP dehydrogenase
LFPEALAFDDVLLKPQGTTIASRQDVSLSTTIAGLKLDIPIISANMATITEAEMAIDMHYLGGLGIIHRMQSLEDYQDTVDKLLGACQKFGYSFGIKDGWKDRVEASRYSASIACLDVAHAHSARAVEVVREFLEESDLPLIIGNVSTYEAILPFYEKMSRNNYDRIAFKVGIGGGSMCTTRINTGCGLPTFQSIYDIHKMLPFVNIIADGGIRSSGDIVKALAAGASAVMIGRLLAGTSAAAGNIVRGDDGLLYKEYRGSASKQDKVARGEVARNIEGESTLVPLGPYTHDVVHKLVDGIRSGLSYNGAKNIKELQEVAQFVRVTSAGYKESTAHGVS